MLARSHAYAARQAGRASWHDHVSYENGVKSVPRMTSVGGVLAWKNLLRFRTRGKLMPQRLAHHMHVLA